MRFATVLQTRLRKGTHPSPEHLGTFANREDEAPIARLQRCIDGQDSQTINPRHISARRLAALGWELCATKLLDHEERALLAFRSDFEADYNRTVGALTGRYSSPDTPCDQLQAWEDRQAFARSITPDDRERINHFERIVATLRQLTDR